MFLLVFQPDSASTSLIFHVLTFVCSLLTANGFQRYSRNHLVHAVLHLKPVIKDQVVVLTRNGTEAAIVDQSTSKDAEIKAGKVPLIYRGPEVLVGSSKW